MISNTVVEVFEAQAALVPENTALNCNGNSVSYYELNSKANRLAHLFISAYSIERGDIIGLLLDKSEQCYVAILAILKCGATYLPLSTDTPKARIEYILTNSCAKLIVTHSYLEPLLKYIAISVIDVADTEKKSGNYPEENLLAAIKPTDRAYIIYTSGTTGEPNGVEIPHSGIVRLVKGNDYFPFAEKNTFLQLSNIGFDAATFEIWGALLNGHVLVSVAENCTDLCVLESVIREYGVSALFLTTSFFNLITEQQIRVLAGLRYLIVGGEALSVKHIEKASIHYPEMKLINGYGPTECTTFACCYQIPADFDFSLSAVPIGYAITETQLYLLDENLNEVPKGEKGELYIGGSGLALAYLKNETLTKARFIQHPTLKQKRIYKTGDICYENSEGAFVFAGRTDNQLKIRGFRVETKEIETKIKQFKTINSCVVIGVNSNWSTDIVAFITAENTNTVCNIERLYTVDIKALKCDLSTWLPGYMIPSVVIELNKFPLNKNGKVDIDQMKKFLIGTNTAENVEHKIQFSNATEETIYKIWRQHFSNCEIKLDDCFFELGGDSLQAVSLTTEINTQLGLNLSPLAIYKNNSIRKLTEYILSQQNELKKNQVIEKLKVGEGEPVYLFSGLNGNALRFVDFVENFGGNNPLYFVNYPVDDIKSFDGYKMESLATYFIEAILKFQPDCKIHLIGYSFGGRLVFEMALQLKKRNINPGLLCIIDIVGPKHSYDNHTKEEKIRNEIKVFKRLKLNLKFKYLKYRLPVLFNPLVNSSTHNNEFNQNSSYRKFDKNETAIRAVFYRIFNKYNTTEKYNGNILLIRTSIQSLSPVDMVYYLNSLSYCNFWDANIKGNIYVQEINSGHIEILSKENVIKVIEAIERYLETKK
jgi:amino acid adenylation domain-containing protein